MSQINIDEEGCIYPDEEIKKKKSLIQLALKKGLSSAVIFDLVVGIKDNYRFDISPLHKELIFFVLGKNIDLNQVHYSEAADDIRNNRDFVSRHQSFVTGNLALILGKIPYISETDIFKEIEKYAGGFCQGLTTIWLYSMWRQFVYLGKSHIYNNDWFKGMTRTLAAWDGRKDFNSYEIDDIWRFGTTINFFSPRFPFSFDVDQQITSSKLDTGGKVLEKRYAVLS